MVCSVDYDDNTLKSGQDLEVIVDRQCRGKFRRFGALCVIFYMLQMKKRKLWNVRQ